MGGILSGLGAFAGGLSQGIERGQRLGHAQQDQQWRNEQRGRQRTLQDRDDALNADLEAANAAMAERMRGFQEEHARTQGPGPRNNLTLGGSDGSMPDQTGNDKPSQVTPFRPDENQMLEAARARTDYLFSKGRHEPAIKQWAQDEALRAQMRKKAVTEGMIAFNSTGDLKPLLSNVYRHLDDGHDLSNLAEVSNHDPNAPRAWDIERVNSRTGEKRVDRITRDQLDELVAFATDPSQAANYSLREKLKVLSAEQQRLTNGQRHTQRLDEIELGNDGREAVAGIRAGATKDAAKIRVDGTIKAAEIRAQAAGQRGLDGSKGASGVQSKTVLEDGRIVLHMRDGSSKVAVDDQGNPLKGVEFQRVINSVSKVVADSIDGMTMSPEQNRRLAEDIVTRSAQRRTPAPAPKPPAPAAPAAGGAKRLVYDPATGSFK